MRRSPFSMSSVYIYSLFSVLSLLSTCWAAPHKAHETRAKFTSNPNPVSSLSKRTIFSTMPRGPLIALGIACPFILFGLCLIVRCMVRSYVNRKVNPSTYVVDLRKEFNPDMSPLTAGPAKGQHTPEKGTRVVGKVHDLRIDTTLAAAGISLGRAYGPMDDDVRAPSRTDSESVNSFHPVSLTPGGIRNPMTEYTVPLSSGYVVASRAQFSARDRSTSEASIHPPVLTPGGRHTLRMSTTLPPLPSTIGDLPPRGISRGNSGASIRPPPPDIPTSPIAQQSPSPARPDSLYSQSTIKIQRKGTQSSFADTPSAIDDTDFRISFWYTEPVGRKSVRPLPVPPRTALSASPPTVTAIGGDNTSNRRPESSFSKDFEPQSYVSGRRHSSDTLYFDLEGGSFNSRPSS